MSEPNSRTGESVRKRREKAGKTKRERKKESVSRDFFFIAVAPLVARGLRATVGRLSRSWVSPPGSGGQARAAVINNAAINPGLSPAGMTAFGKKRRELAAPALSSSSSAPPPLSFPRARLSLSFYVILSLPLSFSLGKRTPGLAPSRGCSRERKTKAGGRRGRIEWRSLVRLSRSVYLSGKEARKRRSSCSVFLSLSLFLSISAHFFQPSPPCDST